MNFFNRVMMCISLSYKLFRVWMQVVYGAWRISKLPHPIISIFGGAKMTQGDKYAKEAAQIARWFVEKQMSILTGGGPGVMEAASCGAIQCAYDGKIHSVGIGVRGLNEPKNTCVEEYFELNYFFARKWLLTQYSSGFIVFPGGFGTMDELSDVLTLIQTGIMKKTPIALIGKDYWDPFMKWIIEKALPAGLISSEHVNLFKITDDPYAAFCFVRGECDII